MSYAQSQSDACRPINGLTTEEFLLYSIRCLSERMKEHTIQLAAHARLQALSTSRDTDAPGTESGLSDPASWRMEAEKLTGTMWMDLGDHTGPEQLVKILPNHLQAENMQPGQIIYLPAEDYQMVALFRPVNRFMDNRFDRVLNRCCRLLDDDGHDTRLLKAVMADAEGAEMLRHEGTVACAAAKGVEIQAFGENRPFLEFISRLIEAGFFREVAEWFYENREKLLEIAKTIAAIIGIFA